MAEISKEWCVEVAKRERDNEVGAGVLALDPSLCPGPCSECEMDSPEEYDHHWMLECADDDGNPVEPHMACKHCPATRDMTDEDVDEIY